MRKIRVSPERRSAARLAMPAAALLLALALAGCGRRSFLDPPPTLGAPAARPAADTGPTQAAPGRPLRPREKKITPPKGPFFLDPIV